MRRFFVVEMKAIIGVPNRMNALVERDPAVTSSRWSRRFPGGIVSRWDWVLRERVKNIGQHQFLMLLLVVEPDFDQRLKPVELICARLAEEFHHGGIDMPSVCRDLVGGGTG